MNQRDIERYKNLLLKRREALQRDLERMEQEALNKSRQSASGDLSNMPIHMADLGSDNFEQEFTLNLIQTQRDELKEIDAALERVEEGTFGLCEICGKPISRRRLQAMPYARLCVECKREEEEKE